MNNIVKIDNSNSWYTCGCIKCGKTVKVLPEQNYTPPSDWHKVELTDHGKTIKRGYFCPDCTKQLDEPITFSVEVNGQIVEPMKTVDRYGVTVKGDSK